MVLDPVGQSWIGTPQSPGSMLALPAGVISCLTVLSVISPHKQLHRMWISVSEASLRWALLDRYCPRHRNTVKNNMKNHIKDTYGIGNNNSNNIIRVLCKELPGVRPNLAASPTVLYRVILRSVIFCVWFCICGGVNSQSRESAGLVASRINTPELSVDESVVLSFFG